MYNHHPCESISSEERRHQQLADEVYCLPPSSGSSSGNEDLRFEDYENSRQQEEEQEKEELGQKIIRGSNGFDFVRQPCKARGVEIKPGQDLHVARFAYIDIPVGTENGTILCCSHPVCSSSGRRFRYCNHCKTAVAKRNFNARHAHPEVKKSRTTASSNTASIGGATRVTNDYSQSSNGYNSSGSTTASSITGSNNQRFEDSQIRTARVASSSTSHHRHLGDTPSSAFSRVSPTTGVEMPLSSQELDMLCTRPGNDYPEALEHWKATVVAMTDKSKSRWACASSTTHHHHTTECLVGSSYCYYGDDSSTSSVLPASSSFDMDAFDISDFPNDFLCEGSPTVR
jgi:hypothetical protein